MPELQHWGRLKARYGERRPRRMLTLDGGGIRGLMTLHALVALEEQLARLSDHPSDFRLAQFFDYFAGTSTGAIIAAGLARGHSVKFLLSFYEEFGRKVFTSRSLLERWKSLYTDGELKKKLKVVFGDHDLGPESLEALLLVVTHNVTTDSAWPLSSNPSAKYNDPARADCNLRIPLWKLVRASTAAPVYFPPEVLELGPREFVFADGGTTSYNNPAFLLARMATEPAYRLNWARGESELLIVSFGTGSAPVLGAEAANPESHIPGALVHTLSVLMSQAAFDQDLSCRTVGRCVHGSELDREVGDLVPRAADGSLDLGKDLGRAFLYARYDAELTDRGLAELGVTGVDPVAVRSLDSVEQMPALERIGKALGKKIDVKSFGSFLEQPLAPRLNLDLA